MGAGAGAVCSWTARSSRAISRPSASAQRSTCRVSTFTPARAANNSLALAKLTSAAALPTSRVAPGDSEVSCRSRARRTAPPPAGGAVIVGPFQPHRAQQRGEGLRAAAYILRRPAARTRPVAVVHVEPLRRQLRGEAEGSATECLLEGLEVLRLHAPRSDERIDFGRESGYERCAPAALMTRSAASRARRHMVRSRASKFRAFALPDRRNASTSVLTAASNAANTSCWEPLFGPVTEPSRRLRLGHGRNPPTRAIGRSALAQYP